jgi:hypothetical protein
MQDKIMMSLNQKVMCHTSAFFEIFFVENGESQKQVTSTQLSYTSSRYLCPKFKSFI